MVFGWFVFLIFWGDVLIVLLVGFDGFWLVCFPYFFGGGGCAYCFVGWF